MNRPVTLAVAATLLALTACGGGSTKAGSDDNHKVCVQALDAADEGFTEFAATLTQVRQAIDLGLNGNPAAGSQALRGITAPSPTRYKALEAQCRAG